MAEVDGLLQEKSWQANNLARQMGTMMLEKTTLLEEVMMLRRESANQKEVFIPKVVKKKVLGDFYKSQTWIEVLKSKGHGPGGRPITRFRFPSRLLR